MSSWSARVSARDAKRPPGFVQPCLLTLSTAVPTGPGWQYEVKHDGYRMLARADGSGARIWSRHGRSWSNSFPTIAAGLRQLGRAALIDGEALCQLEDGRSDFYALKGEDGCRRAVLWCFDLLELDGEDIRALPLEARRDRLRALLEAVRPQGLAFSDHQDEDGEALFAAACRMNLEGIVAKRKGTRYASGRCRHWLKIKNPGFTRPETYRPVAKGVGQE